ncbi:hypothetical protein OF83DRAFT_1153873, partial [Amylostereum chailletii]
MRIHPWSLTVRTLPTKHVVASPMLCCSHLLTRNVEGRARYLVVSTRPFRQTFSKSRILEHGRSDGLTSPRTPTSLELFPRIYILPLLR